MSDDPRARLRARIAEMDAARGHSLTATEKIAKLKAAMCRCYRCEKDVEINWPFCAWCGDSLHGDG